jgi:hypothetical protein
VAARRTGPDWFRSVGLTLVSFVIGAIVGVALALLIVNWGRPTDEPITGRVEGFGMTDPGHLEVGLTINNWTDEPAIARCLVTAITADGAMGWHHIHEPIAPNGEELVTVSINMLNNAARHVDSLQVTDCY